MPNSTVSYADGLPRKRIINIIYNNINRLIKKMGCNPGGGAVCVAAHKLISADLINDSFPNFHPLQKSNNPLNPDII